jgi:hypothetical protein
LRTREMTAELKRRIEASNLYVCSLCISISSQIAF